MHILQIKKTKEFQNIGSNCEKFFSKNLILLTKKVPEKYLPNKSEGKMADDFCRFGVTVSKKVSKLAYLRNKAKRRLRHAFKNLAPKLAQNHFDYVIIAKKNILEGDFKTISSDLKFCLKRIHGVKKK